MMATSKEQILGFLNTPPLWRNGEMFDLNQFQIPDIPTATLLETTIDIPAFWSHYVLGKRMEILFDHIICHSLKHQVIAKNLQIFNEKITLGEIDFLVKNHEVNAVYHIELVFKFYIYDPSIPDITARWIGPNRRDSLLQKISRLKHHQLPLLYRSETIKVLESYNLCVKEIEQKVCFKATLFVPKGSVQPYLSGINYQCIVGHWIKFVDFTPQGYGDNLYYAPQKLEWPLVPQANEDFISYDSIKRQIEELIKKRRSPLIWMQHSTGTYERFFVVWW